MQTNIATGTPGFQWPHVWMRKQPHVAPSDDKFSVDVCACAPAKNMALPDISKWHVLAE